ncbi:related to DAL81-transcriptional activator for allantoin and GABA catabolic genes [Rhynchosporium graminicola]|uniref:Related to DAL81-transcriptional activator for allantoin and GABA catabolic genes n=1 Tax=Rhynchosporium graminicola TaxID=2792576 RepID=A0A1E1L2S0_9HELO|nr:related to DAL81-transcriptional activator for allantoin and GABA catabolic genes [Rhynchosporium commune]
MDSPQQPKRKDRPCDACRKRKSRCVLEDESPICVLCKFHNQECTFVQNPQSRKRKGLQDGDDPVFGKRRQSIASYNSKKSLRAQRRVIRTTDGTGVEEYDDLQGPSLLKKTLGLQNKHHSQYLGATRGLESSILGRLSQSKSNELQLTEGILRRVSSSEAFLLLPDPGTQGYEEELNDLDEIEAIVRPHGKALLAAVYLLALQYWSYNDDLNKLTKPNVQKLEELARKALGDTIHRPKLSTVQAGLLFLQHTDTDSAEVTAQLISVAYGLGLHLDASNWNIPDWEKGLRKRLGWGLYMQDKWSSLSSGRPALINSSNWDLNPVTDADFPERVEDEQEGSSEVHKGRILFSRMITLSEILAEILETVFTVKASKEIAAAGANSLNIVLGKVKPVQLKLKNWFTNLPECLSMESTLVMKLNSVGYLRLAYIATEISLHRRILLALSPSTDPHLYTICRSVAHERFMFAIHFVQSLKPQHLSSFWYFASPQNFALIGVLGTLLLSTASSHEESEFYRTKLREFRWTLKINNENGARFMKPAMALHDANLGLLEEASTNSTGSPPIPALVAEQHSMGSESIASDSVKHYNSTRTHRLPTGDFRLPGQFTFHTPCFPDQHPENTTFASQSLGATDSSSPQEPGFVGNENPDLWSY